MKTFETPNIFITRFDPTDVITVSDPMPTGIWEGYDGFTEASDAGVEVEDFDW